MRINSEEEFMKYCLATAMTASMNDVVLEGLLDTYKCALALETKHGHKTTVKDMKANALMFLTEAVGKQPVPIPEGFDMEEIAECYAGWLWCLNMVEAVEAKLEMMEIMSGVVTAMRQSDEREFQEKNR